MGMSTCAAIIGIMLTGIQAAGWAVDSADIPDKAPADAVMASRGEILRVADWASRVFLGKAPDQEAPKLELKVLRQDFNTLRFGESCMQTPITIGSKQFAHGLGTHANSEIAVTLPAGATQFRAFAGIDNNYDTGGMRGTAVFSVEVDGKELARTPVLRGGGEPSEVVVDIPEGAQSLLLKVDTTEDGPSHDQSDWADALIVMADGAIIRLDENQRGPFLSEEHAPFSFIYGGKPSEEFIGDWTRESTTRETDDFSEHTVTWTDPATALRVSAIVKVFKDYPAAEWLLHFENTGGADTPIIENILPLDLGLRTGERTVLRRNMGDSCAEQSFMMVEDALKNGETVRFAPVGGRSSNGAFPFFDLCDADTTLITAIGWSGQWAVEIGRSESAETNLRAGMELTRLLLHPGESIRTPRILLLLSKGDVETAHNRFRRLMLFQYVPKIAGKPVRVPVALQCYDRYRFRPGWATEQGQREMIAFAKKSGFDAHWFDAAWFPGEFPDGVGNWYAKPGDFPNGLKPLGDDCDKNDVDFILWFEPERVVVGTQIALEHPEFVHEGTGSGLFKLDDPEARRWLTELLIQRVSEYGVDVYRNDFNIDPLSFWRKNDAPDRQGITEIRYIEGLYEMWDELRSRVPGLVIDNCASGGRRIDLEMCSRSIPLWRSDTNCFGSNCEWNQGHSLGLGQYAPLHTSCAWNPDTYEMRSDMTAGLICQWGYLEDGFPVETAKANLAEIKDNLRFWYGDMYALTRNNTLPGQWCAYQLHREDLKEGLVLVFRRADSAYSGLEIALKALKSDKSYTLTLTGDDHSREERTLSGNDLMERLELQLTKPRSSLLIRYQEE